jgi:hypothetical protein
MILKRGRFNAKINVAIPVSPPKHNGMAQTKIQMAAIWAPHSEQIFIKNA